MKILQFQALVPQSSEQGPFTSEIVSFILVVNCDTYVKRIRPKCSTESRGTYWTSRKSCLQQIELSSINKVR